ncbi:hypothetical protein IAU59_001228 [Kwoniella sp. CBS 9459]
MVKPFLLFLALAPALVFGVPNPQDADKDNATSTSSAASSNSDSATSTSTSSAATTDTTSDSTSSAASKSDTSSGPASSDSSTNHAEPSASSTSATTSANTQASSGTSTSNASGTDSAATSTTTSGAAGSADLAAIASQTYTSAKSEKTQARVAGDKLEPRCEGLHAPPEEDWLFAPICGMVNANPQWVLSSISSNVTGFDLTNEAGWLNFATYDSRGRRSGSEAVVFKDMPKIGSRNPDKAWFGSGFRSSILQDTNRELVVSSDGHSEFSTERYEEWAAWYGLVYLTGFQPARDRPDAISDGMWSLWMAQSERTPVVLKTASWATSVVGDRHYAVTGADMDAEIATVWSPSTKEQDQYLNVSYKDLKQQTQYIYHLDWATW